MKKKQMNERARALTTNDKRSELIVMRSLRTRAINEEKSTTLRRTTYYESEQW